MISFESINEKENLMFNIDPGPTRPELTKRFAKRRASSVPRQYQIKEATEELSKGSESLDDLVGTMKRKIDDIPPRYVDDDFEEAEDANTAIFNPKSEETTSIDFSDFNIPGEAVKPEIRVQKKEARPSAARPIIRKHGRELASLLNDNKIVAFRAKRREKSKGLLESLPAASEESQASRPRRVAKKTRSTKLHQVQPPSFHSFEPPLLLITSFSFSQTKSDSNQGPTLVKYQQQNEKLKSRTKMNRQANRSKLKQCLVTLVLQCPGTTVSMLMNLMSRSSN